MLSTSSIYCKAFCAVVRSAPRPSVVRHRPLGSVAVRAPIDGIRKGARGTEPRLFDAYKIRNSFSGTRP